MEGSVSKSEIWLWLIGPTVMALSPLVWRIPPPTLVRPEDPTLGFPARVSNQINWRCLTATFKFYICLISFLVSAMADCHLIFSTWSMHKKISIEEDSLRDIIAFPEKHCTGQDRLLLTYTQQASTLSIGFFESECKSSLGFETLWNIL